MKWSSIGRFIKHYISSILGKLLGYIVTPLVYPHRDWLRNYIWNWMQVNGIKCNRSTIWAEDEFKYYTKNGYITKRKTNKYLGYILAIPYFKLDDDSNLTITSLMFHKPEDVIGLNIWKNWGNFKKFYYWMVIRNGFYNFNYIVEDSYLDACGEFETVSPRIKKDGPNPVEFSEHRFYQDSNGKWFFILTKCKHFRGKVYGYEFGWRRKDLNGTNLVTRIYFGKPIEKEG